MLYVLSLGLNCQLWTIICESRNYLLMQEPEVGQKDAISHVPLIVEPCCL